MQQNEHTTTPADFLTTWLEVTFKPGSFFSRSPPRRSVCGPLLFSVLMNTCADVSGAILDLLLTNRTAGAGFVVIAGTLLWTPVWTCLTLYISAGLLHGVLKVIGTGRA